MGKQTKKQAKKKTTKKKSKKKTPQQEKFSKAFKTARANGFKPFTKAFGAEMKRLLAK